MWRFLNDRIYSLGIAMAKKTPVALERWTGETPSRALIDRVSAILEKERARGGAFCLFDGRSVSCAAFGRARLRENIQVTPDTYFRLASISKLVTAYAAVQLSFAGVVSLSRDVSDYLGFSVRNPRYKDKKITLRQLLSHTSSIVDGEKYMLALAEGAPLGDLLASPDSFAPYAPGEKWEYSNFAAGMIGCVLEGATGKPFDALMRETVFEPAGVLASYYPQRIKGTLADAWRLFPPSARPNFDANARRNKPLPGDDAPDLARDYLLAHGSLCITAPGLCRIACAVDRNKEAFDVMRAVVAPFGPRDATLSQGLGTFIYRSGNASVPVLYGHQGLAYGAVNGLFMDENGRGFCILTSAASEKRTGVLTNMNRALCEAVFAEEGT